MDCLFCKIIEGIIPSKTIYESENVIAFLDINPKECGHTLVVPKKHIKDIYELEDTNTLKEECEKVATIINEKLNSTGIMFVTNTGSLQEVKHLHIHLIPEYNDKLNLNVDEIYEKITK